MLKLKLAFRTLWKTPFVSIVAILSLGLGLGANAAIFSLFNQALLKPLPVRDPGGLVNLASPGPKSGSTSCGAAGTCDAVFSYPMFRDLERVQQVFSGIAAHVGFSANFAYEGQTSTGEGLFVSGSYFPLLGLQPLTGRLIGPNDDRVVGEPAAVVLSQEFWRTRFGQDPHVIGRQLTVNGQSLTIAGVAPEGFNGTTLGNRPQVFVPLTMRRVLQSGFRGFEDRQSYWAYLFARLKPGVTLDQARAGINPAYHAIINDVEAPLQHMSEQTLARFKSRQITLENGSHGQSTFQNEVRAPLSFLIATTGLVLLIACVNITSLLLTRSVARSGEMAVRLSLGANRRQLAFQLLTESTVLAMFGGFSGILIGHWVLRFIASLIPEEAASILQFRIDRDVVLFLAVLTLGTSLLFGLFPALHATRRDVFSTLKKQAGQPGGARSAVRLRTIMATAQIALSMTLLVSAGLFTKSLWKVGRVDLGMKVESVVTFAVSPGLNGYTPERSRVFYERLEEELAALPGANEVTASLVQLLSGSNYGSNVSVQKFQAGPDTDTNSNYNDIGPDYFRTLGIPLLSGREFTRADALKAPKAIIVNETFARKFNLGRDAVGKRMKVGSGGELDAEIVGLVQDSKYSAVKGEPRPVFYRPYRQNERLNTMNFYVRAASPEAFLTSVRSVVSRLDPALPVSNLRTLQFQVWDNITEDRVVSILSAAFAVLATVLAAIGLYGVLAYAVAQRTREIGLRMALGAEPGRVLRMVLRQVSWMTFAGAAIGLAAGAGLGRMAESMLFNMKGYDPVVLGCAAAILGLIAFAAGYIPAHRASRIDPMRALRYE
jgi:predicted permease